MTENTSLRLKNALKARCRQLVVNIDYSNASLVQFIAKELADVIFIDCEQGDTSIQTIPDLVRASHIELTPAVVRLPYSDAATIERYLFRGVDGIVAPRLNSAAQARDVVEATKYCLGKRAEQAVIIVQIESRQAASDLEAFLAIDEIDAFFVGPVDLARSLGHAGDFTVPEVDRLIGELLTRIADANRSAGMLCSCHSIGAIERLGANFLYLHANDFLRHGKQPFSPSES